MSLANGLQGMYDPQTQGRPGEVGDVWGLFYAFPYVNYETYQMVGTVLHAKWQQKAPFDWQKHHHLQYGKGYFYMQRRKEKASGTLRMFTLNVNRTSIPSYKCASAIGQLSSFHLVEEKMVACTLSNEQSYHLLVN